MYHLLTFLKMKTHRIPAIAAALTLLFFLAAWQPALAQSKWSLQRCVDYALDNNLQLKLNELNIQQNEAAYIQSVHNRYPNLNGFISHNYAWGRSFDVFTNAPVTQRVQSNSIGVQSSVTVFNGLQITNTIKQRRIELEASEYDQEKAKNDMVLNLTGAYLTILLNLENLENTKRLVANTDEQLIRTEQLVKAGVLPEANLFDLRSQKATNELQVVTTENQVALAYLQLKQLLQLPESEEFEIEVPQIADPQNIRAFESADAIYGTAESAQPDVRAADLRIQSSRLGIDVARSNLYPSISLSGGFNTFFSSAQLKQFVGTERTGVVETIPIGYVVNPLDPAQQFPVFRDVEQERRVFGDFGFWRQLEEARRYTLGLNMNIPIYNRHQVRTQIQTAQIAHERARLSSQITRQTLRQNVEQAYIDAVAASKTYQANIQQLAAVQEQFRVTQQRYNLGVANVTDFTIAQNNLNNANSNLIRAKFDLIFRMKILDFYMGRPIKL